MTKNTRFEDFLGSRLPRDIQMKRLRQVILEELTDFQREAILCYYFQGMTLEAIAKSRGVNRSTVFRTLHRAEENLKKYLAY